MSSDNLLTNSEIANNFGRLSLLLDSPSSSPESVTNFSKIFLKKKKQNKVIERIYQQDLRSKNELFKLKATHISEIIKELPFSPHINEKSSNKHSLPMHLRIDKVLAQRRESIEKLKAQKIQDEIYQETLTTTFTPEITTNRPNRKIQTYLQDVEKWQEKKRQNHHAIALDYRVSEMEKLTFQPTINKKSQKIFKSKPYEKASERLYNCHKEWLEKKKAIREIKEHSFQPFINKNSIAIAEKIEKKKIEKEKELDEINQNYIGNSNKIDKENNEEQTFQIDYNESVKKSLFETGENPFATPRKSNLFAKSQENKEINSRKSIKSEVKTVKTEIKKPKINEIQFNESHNFLLQILDKKIK